MFRAGSVPPQRGVSDDRAGLVHIAQALGFSVALGFGAAIYYHRRAATLSRQLHMAGRALQAARSASTRLQTAGTALESVRARHARVELALQQAKTANATLETRCRREEERRTQLAVELVVARNNTMDSLGSAKGTYPEFAAREGDVFTVTFPKCGTTWVTHIVHGLRSGGNLDFGEITEVVPWDIYGPLLRQDLDADHTHPVTGQPLPFRAFKSHCTFGQVARTQGTPNTEIGGAKYIIVTRDPRDAFLSFHKFLPDYMGLRPGDVSQTAFCDSFFADQPDCIWDYLLSWFPHRANPNVLLLCFETLVQDLEGSVRLIAKFCGLDADDELIELVVKQSTYKFMSRPDMAHHFDDHVVAEVVRKAIGVSDREQKVHKVRKGGGKAGQARNELNAYVHGRLGAKWAETVEAATGLQSYEELRAVVESENRERAW